jgi:N-acylglucosamine 2-epimerase
MGYTSQELRALHVFYKDMLVNKTLPFWFPRSYDLEHDGFLFMRDRDGSLLDDDKAVWIQGRATWTLSTVYNNIEQKEEWMKGAALGFRFLRDKCFDTDGRMFFHMSRDGSPIRKRRYFFSETFFVIGAAAYGQASGNEEAMSMARDVFGKCIAYMQHPEILPPKFTGKRPMRGIGVPMIMMNTAQQLRETIGDDRCNDVINECISQIETYFVKHDIKCVMEAVLDDGQISDHIDGRMLNPGHAIEGAWFILYEAVKRGFDQKLISLGCSMLDYMWERGWDSEYGGLFYFRDVYGKPVQEYWHDMKFWWPHNEAIVATLMAYLVTGNEKYARWHKMVHDYAYGRFYDDEYGEWFGYLHRDGRISQTAKGNLFKGPFHLPRQEFYCMQMLSDHPENPFRNKLYAS